MKNEAIEHDASPEEAWGQALRRFDRELRRRGAADRTRRAYGADCGELARWAAAQRLRPRDVAYPVLRRWAGVTPRKVASARAFFRVLVEDGELHANPADRLAPPGLSRALAPHELARLLDRIPATTPLELRDRAMFELAHGCDMGAEELAGLDLRAIELDAGVPALRSVAHYLKQARPALVGDAGEPALFLSKSGRRLSASDIRRRLQVWARHAAAHGAARELLGQSSISTTPVYTRVESARLRAAYERSHPRA